MSASPNLDHLALLKFGIAVPSQHREEVLKLVKTSPAYKEEFEQIKNSLNTMLNQDDFLEEITNSHTKIAEIPENNKVIMKRQTTFQIRAINPEHISSLTERAFFNSFSLERIILNDQEEQISRKQALERDEERNNQREKPQKEQQKKQNDDQDKCICGKVIPDSLWIECSHEGKCRGSGWYHTECAGIKAKEEDLDRLQFICEYCRRPSEEQKEPQSSQKRFKYVI